jgi:LPXTG-site transpeptidase (sortase) family protein
MANRLSRINTLLVVMIVLVNLFVLVTPLWPAFLYTKAKNSPKAQAITQQVTQPAPSDIPADAQTLLVPSMVLEADIHEGPGMKTLNHGLWRLPHTSTPDKGSNTVIVAHRFTYTNPRGTFYHLDKVRTGESIAVLWHGKKYTYNVVETKRVPATEMSVEAPTDTPTLTLYTCTPLWNPKDRLVVRAELQE